MTKREQEAFFCPSFFLMVSRAVSESRPSISGTHTQDISDAISSAFTKLLTATILPLGTALLWPSVVNFVIDLYLTADQWVQPI